MNTKRKKIFKIALLIIFIAILLVYLFPFIWIIMTGFRTPIETYGWPPKFIFTPNLDAFSKLFKDMDILSFLKNSLVISSISTIVTLFISTPAAYALSHLKSKSNKNLLFVLLLGRLIPPIAIIIPLFLIATYLKQIDTYQVIIIVYTVINIPFAIWLLRSFFMDIPVSIREAAIVDGCSEYGAFLKTMLPLSKAGLMTSAIFVFITCWNEFIFAYTLTSKNVSTITGLMKAFKTQYGVMWGQMGAASLIASIPIVIFAIIMQKYLVRGMTMGAIKE